MNSKWAVSLVCLAGLGLAACDPGPEAIATAKPATGSELADFAKNVTKKVKLGRDASIVQYFCHTATGAGCPADIASKLAAYGFKSDSDGVDLAYVFASMAADAKDGKTDKSSTDEDFLAASYRVVLGREPDEGGAKTNLAFVKDTGQRKTMLRSMLESPEFKAK